MPKVQLKKWFEEVPVGQLRVPDNMNAQRQYQSSWANKLAKLWDPELLMVATVSKRKDGSYCLIDGQHSTSVALDKEGPEFTRDCIVYEGLTEAQEARLFLAANRDRKPVRPYDNFKVALTAGDSLVRQISAEVRSCGVEVSAGTSPNCVGSVQALLAIGRRREGLIARTLPIVEEAFGREKGLCWDNMMLRAVSMVLHDNWDRVEDKRLVETLQKYPVGRWKQSGVQNTPSGGGSASRSTPLAEAILGVYNSRLRTPEKMLVLHALAR